MRWEELTRSEARMHLDTVVAALPGALDRLAADVDRRVVLDGHRDSLVRLWRWVCKQRNSGGVLPADAPDAPPWYPFKAVWCQHYGVEASLVRVIDGVAAYYAHCLQVAEPARQWTVGGRNASDTGYAEYNAPVLQLGTHDAVPYAQIPTLVHRAVVKRTVRDREPEALARVFDMATAASGSASEVPDVEVEATGPGRLVVTLPETLEARLGRPAFEALVDRMADLDGIDHVAWQDREVVVVTGGITPQMLTTRVRELLAD